MAHPFLYWWEVALIRLLSRSPRIGLLMVKQHSGNLSWVINDRSDQQPMGVIEVERPISASDMDPPSMRFERAYHMPDAGTVYLPSAGVGSAGATPVHLGIETMFKPWYFTGRVVYWGKLCSTRSSALAEAQRLAEHHLTA